MDKMVGHGPSLDFGPTVPDFIIVQDELGHMRAVSRSGDISGNPEALYSRSTPCTPEPVRTGCWPIVFTGGDHPVGGAVPRIDWLLLSDEARWRAEWAKRVLSAAQSVKGNPELALRTVRAASALVSFDLEKVARELTAFARPGESIGDAFDRQRRR